MWGGEAGFSLVFSSLMMMRRVSGERGRPGSYGAEEGGEGKGQ